MKPSDELTVTLIFGPPGAGKGTQAGLLVEKFGFVHLETSKVLEAWIKNTADTEYAEIDGKRYTTKEQQKLWEGGILMDPPLVAFLVEKEVRQLYGEKKSIVTSGAFRTVDETERMYPVFAELYGKENISALLLKLEAEESIYRNSHRRICELVRHPILYTKETENLEHCPLDGSKLVRRKGLDDPETIKVRLKEYEERTLPVIELLRGYEVPIANINGNQSVADVFADIVSAIQ